MIARSMSTQNFGITHCVSSTMTRVKASPRPAIGRMMRRWLKPAADMAWISLSVLMRCSTVVAANPAEK